MKNTEAMLTDIRDNLQLPKLVNIAHEISSADKDKVTKLTLQSKNIKKVSSSTLAKQRTKLEEAEEKPTNPMTQRVIAYMKPKMQEINELLFERKAQEKITREGYIRYLIQAWYCSNYTRPLQAKLRQRLAEYIQSRDSALEQGSKFISMLESEIVDETGHEILALQDLQQLGVKQFDTSAEVFSESRDLITTQSELLNRHEFMGFLGYSSYMEFLFAKYIGSKLKLLSEQGIPREAQTFLYNHYVIDLEHAGDDIELLNFFVDNDEIVTAVIENINVVHSLYKGIVDNAFN